MPFIAGFVGLAIAGSVTSLSVDQLVDQQIQDTVISSSCQGTLVKKLPVDKPFEHVSFFPFKRETDYELFACGMQGDDVIAKVQANQSASMLKTPAKVNLQEGQILSWSWFVQRSNVNTDTNNPKKEDAPVRVVLAFDGDRSTLKEEEQSFLSQMDWVTGRKAPFASLMYVVGGATKSGEVVKSKHSDTIRFIVLQNIADKQVLNQWYEFERDVYLDYKKAFGSEPGSLIGIGVMGDMDNTGGESVAYVKNLRLSDLPVIPSSEIQK